MASFVSREDAIYRWAQQHAQATGRPSAFLDSTAHYFEHGRPQLLSPPSSSSTNSRRSLFSSATITSSSTGRPRSLASRASSSSLASTQSQSQSRPPPPAVAITADELESEDAYEERRSIYDQRPAAKAHAQQSSGGARKSGSRSSSKSSSGSSVGRRDYFSAMFGVK